MVVSAKQVVKNTLVVFRQICPLFGVFSHGLLETKTTARGDSLTPSMRLERTHALPASRQVKEGPSSIKGKGDVRKGFLLVSVSVFQACTVPISYQVP